MIWLHHVSGLTPYQHEECEELWGPASLSVPAWNLVWLWDSQIVMTLGWCELIISHIIANETSTGTSSPTNMKINHCKSLRFLQMVVNENSLAVTKLFFCCTYNKNIQKTCNNYVSLWHSATTSISGSTRLGSSVFWDLAPPHRWMPHQEDGKKVRWTAQPDPCRRE